MNREVSDEIARLDRLQAALEDEQHRLDLETYHIRRSLEHLRRCRREIQTGRPVMERETA